MRDHTVLYFQPNRRGRAFNYASLKIVVRHQLETVKFESNWNVRYDPYRDVAPAAAPGDLLLIEDVRLVRQTCDWASVAFDDAAVADYYGEQVDAGRTPEEFARVWAHTHPGNSARPSLTDEVTFAGVFGRCQWSVMLILARGGETYARLQFGVGPGAQLQIPVEIDWGVEFEASDWAAWQAEYEMCVVDAASSVAGGTATGLRDVLFDDQWPRRDDLREDFRDWDAVYEEQERPL